MSEDQAIKLIGHAYLPWSTGSKSTVVIIQTWDSPKQIAECCRCCKARCNNCVEKKSTENGKRGGRGHYRDLSDFASLMVAGVPRKDICKMLNISERTYSRMKRDMQAR